MAVEIRLTITKALKTYGQANLIMHNGILRAATEAVKMMKHVLANENSQVVFGDMKRGWITAVKAMKSGVTASVMNKTVQASTIEHGSKKHFPPITKRRVKTPGKRGRGRLESMKGLPALGPWIIAAPRARGFTWDNFDVIKRRDVFRLAYIIGRKFKAKGRDPTYKFSKAVKYHESRVRKVVEQHINLAMQKIKDLP